MKETILKKVQTKRQKIRERRKNKKILVKQVIFLQVVPVNFKK